MAQLIVIEGPDMGREFSLGARAVLGSDASNEVALLDRRLPRKHAEIRREGSGFVLKSLAKDPCVYVNSEPTQERRLSHGDMIALQDTILLFSDEDATAEAVVEVLDDVQPAAAEPETRSDPQIQYSRAAYDGATSLLKTLQERGSADRKLEALLRIASEIGQFEAIDKLLDDCLAITLGVIAADRGYVILVDEDQRRPVFMAGRSRREGRLERPPTVSRTLLRRVFETRKSILSLDAPKEFSGAMSIADLNIRSVMCVPLLSREHGEAMGLVVLEISQAGRQFSQDDLDLLTAIAFQAAAVIEKARIYHRHREYTDRLKALEKAMQKFTAFLERAPIVKEVAKSACGVLSCTKASVVLVGDDGKLDLAAAVGMEKEGWIAGEHHAPEGHGYVERVVRDRAPLLVADSKGLNLNLPLDRGGRYRTDSFLIVPVFSKSSRGDDEVPVLGAVSVTDKVSGGAFTEEDQELLTILAAQAGIAISNAALYERATVDALTRVYVRGHFFHLIEMELQAGARTSALPALLMLDLDHFKSKNDTYGHPAGDAILRETGNLLKGSVREDVYVARYGGEEFAVLLPRTSLDVAAKVAERIRAALEAHPFDATGIQVRLTVSVGVGLAHPGERQDEFIARVDKALYKAKQGGRNRVVVSE